MLNSNLVKSIMKNMDWRNGNGDKIKFDAPKGHGITIELSVCCGKQSSKGLKFEVLIYQNETCLKCSAPLDVDKAIEVFEGYCWDSEKEYECEDCERTFVVSDGDCEVVCPVCTRPRLVDEGTNVTEKGVE